MCTATPWHAEASHSGKVCVAVQTEVMKRRLLAESPISPSRVVVVPDSGMSFPSYPAQDANLRRNASSAFTFLSVALCTPNKNLGVLVEAVKRLRMLTDRPFRCVLTIDPQQYRAGRELLANIQREAVGHLLLNAGHLPPERLSRVYESADAFILPTLLESFCRPYDEAMHFGLPILTSDRDFAHERCQGAAVYFDPLDAASVAQSMLRLMEDSTLRETLVANGRRILAQAPTWEEVAARFVEVLERTAAEKTEPCRGRVSTCCSRL
jgi:glycosyltransferase involved in cell wall biosynthesis